ncbi:PH domain-containing protein [Halovivax limisalsi]|uniref:PH domain-containing protein n=1 Tax=Halovivax limisalsi TaxID=1453760 RepID=UPI001FFC5E48|nr:PH domain-containing protein [Halovivax limisalsi]
MRSIAEATDWLHLAGDETVLWSSRPHPIALGSRFVSALAITVFALVATAWAWDRGYTLVGWVAVSVALLGIVAATAAYVRWTNTRYVITSDQLYAKRGVISRSVTQLSLERVQNTTLEQSVAGRILGYGDVAVYTAGSGSPEVTFVRAPTPGDARSALATQIGRSGNAGRV